eukprot:scaffold290114_cov17-Tisochrysis_lutea.AAC.1
MAWSGSWMCQSSRVSLNHQHCRMRTVLSRSRVCAGRKACEDRAVRRLDVWEEPLVNDFSALQICTVLSNRHKQWSSAAREQRIA